METQSNTPEQTKIAKDNVLICNNNKPLKGNDIAPPLNSSEEYTAKEVFTCNCGELHIDVGLVSKYNWVSCYKCSEKLPKGDEIHWCHSSRFDIKK